jgi:putative PIN family toxin of toxin-antitoxin system
MLIVLDTNVLFQALKSNTGASHYILHLVREEKVLLALSMQVFHEYEDVLKRPEKIETLGLSLTDIENVLRFIAYIGKPFVTYFLFRPNLRDENDNIFVELAIASHAGHIITSNIRDFTHNANLKFDNIKAITPTEFVKDWRENHEN